MKNDGSERMAHPVGRSLAAHCEMPREEQFKMWLWG